MRFVMNRCIGLSFLLAENIGKCLAKQTKEKAMKAMDEELSREDREEIKSFFGNNREIPPEDFLSGGGMHVESLRKGSFFEKMPLNCQVIYILKVAGIEYEDILKFASKAKSKRTLISWYQKALTMRIKREVTS